MPITAAMIAGVITQARTTFPTRACNVIYGEGGEHTATAFHSSPIKSNSDSELGGVIEGKRGELIITLSDCDPWTPPADGDAIALSDTDDNVIGRYYVLGHDDEGTSPAVFRRLYYGEESA